MDKKIVRINGGQETPAPVEPLNGSENCGGCFYSRFKNLDDKQGACHCNPPQLIAVPQQDRITGQMTMNIHSFFPVITRENWCGAFEPAIIDEDDPTMDKAALRVYSV